MTSMKEPKICKVTLNIGVGEAGSEVEKAVKLLKKITGQEPVRTVAKQKIPNFGIRSGQRIGAKVTLRGEKATDFLERAFEAVDNKISTKRFDRQGNLSFGIKEYINLPGEDFDPDIGILGMDVCVTLERPGYRVERRKKETGEVGRQHRLEREDSIDFIKRKFGIEVEGYGKE